MRYLILAGLAITIFACGGEVGPSADLKLIPRHEIITRVKAGKFDYRFAKMKNQKGKALSDKENKLLNAGELGKDYYEDANGVIKEVIVRPVEIEDKFVDIQRREIETNPLQGVRIVDIDCESIDEIYTKVDSLYKAVRKARGDVAGVDTKNLEIVVSAISKCGWTPKHMQKVWKVLSNSPPEVLSYYYEDLVAFSNKGNLSYSSIALMRDRMLNRHGYKQLYGTQILSGQLYKLEDPDNVNVRRQKMGMGKLEDHLKIWGLDFESEKERLRNEE